MKALANTVVNAWKQFESIKLENVYNRWKMVLDLIIEDEGGDANIESKRSKLFRAPTEEEENLFEEGNEEEDEIGAIKAETN